MGHGYHWEAAAGAGEDVIANWIPAIVHKGSVIGRSTYLCDDGEHPPREEQCFGVAYPDGPFRFVALISTNSVSEPKSNIVFTAYPFPHDGCVNSLTIKSAVDWVNPNEGIVNASTESAEFSFFDPLYFLNKSSYKIGYKADFIITALSYVFRACEQHEIKVDGGPLLEIERANALKEDPNADINKITTVSLSLEHACWLMPADAKSDYYFRGIPEFVERIEADGQGFYKVTIVLARPEETDFRAAVYASEAILDGYIPKVGEPVEGVLWLQGRPSEDAIA
ncbi:hypothetical protein DB345_02530 [Spartobacteria bacterium LR76]|nr:hypothetical protein DB345_02530 [Spartobacteria bacterium LR76]